MSEAWHETRQAATRPSDQSQRSVADKRRVAHWTRDYAPLPGIPDEFIGPDGTPRAASGALLDALRRTGAGRHRAALRRRRPPHPRHRRLLSRPRRERASGSWPLSRLPLLIAESRLAADLPPASRSAPNCSSACCATSMARPRWSPRARLPAAAVAGSTRLSASRSAASSRRAGAGCSLYAADIGRGPDGRWWVLGDRAQAPSGLGLCAGKPAGHVARLRRRSTRR